MYQNPPVVKYCLDIDRLSSFRRRRCLFCRSPTQNRSYKKKIAVVMLLSGQLRRRIVSSRVNLDCLGLQSVFRVRKWINKRNVRIENIEAVKGGANKDIIVYPVTNNGSAKLKSNRVYLIIKIWTSVAKLLLCLDFLWYSSL